MANSAPMGHWMSKAVPPSHKGNLHKALGVPMGKKIPPAKVATAKKAGGHLGQMANLANVFAKFRPS